METIDWINSIIKELVEPKNKVKDILLKVQVLAFKIKNDKLKEWVDKELNGFVGKKVPEYRKIPSEVRGNLIQDRGIGGMLTNKNRILPIEYLEKRISDVLMTVSLNTSVSQLEHMLDKGENYQINVPHIICNEIGKLLLNRWVIDSAWQVISLNNIEGVISSIKSNLLTFLLELADEIGEKGKINIMEHKKQIDSIFDKTIGNLTGETINISIGSDNLQSVSMGANSNINVAKGKKVDQKLNIEVKRNLEKFIEEVKHNLEKIPIELNEKQNVRSEISTIESELTQKKPNLTMINEALKVIYGIFIGVAGNALTEPILAKLNSLITSLTF